MERVRAHPLFAQVEEETLTQALAGGELVQVLRGETIYTPQCFQRSLGILLEGRVQVRREQMLVSTLNPGDLFGAAALFCPQEDFPTTLTALTPCQVFFLPQERVGDLLHTSGAFAENYTRYLSGRIRFLSTRLNTVAASGGEGKLSQYLLSAQDDRGEVTLSATQLCSRIAVGRATLYRAFEALEKAGGIARQGKTIRILDPEVLRVCGNIHCGKESKP